MKVDSEDSYFYYEKILLMTFILNYMEKGHAEF